jgi:type 1 glutamine amidotransferase
VSEQDGKEYPTMWINDYHGTRVFGTTFGHGNATWKDPVFITVVARGILWAAGHE